MKRFINIYLIIVLISIFALTQIGCAQSKEISIDGEDGKRLRTKFKPYGLFNPQDHNPNVEYKVSTGSIVLIILLGVSVIPSIIIVGWYLYEPVGEVKKINGQIVPGATNSNY